MADEKKDAERLARLKRAAEKTPEAYAVQVAEYGIMMRERDGAAAVSDGAGKSLDESEDVPPRAISKPRAGRGCIVSPEAVKNLEAIRRQACQNKTQFPLALGISPRTYLTFRQTNIIRMTLLADIATKLHTTVETLLKPAN